VLIFVFMGFVSSLAVKYGIRLYDNLIHKPCVQFYFILHHVLLTSKPCFSLRTGFPFFSCRRWVYIA